MQARQRAVTITRIAPGGLAARNPSLRPGLVLTSVQGHAVWHTAFKAPPSEGRVEQWVHNIIHRVHILPAAAQRTFETARVPSASAPESALWGLTDYEELVNTAPDIRHHISIQRYQLLY